MNFLVPDLAMVPSDDSSSSLVMPMPESLWVQAQSVGPWGLRITHRAWIANLPPSLPNRRAMLPEASELGHAACQTRNPASPPNTPRTR